MRLVPFMLAAIALLPLSAGAQSEGLVEVVEIRGIIDAPVERTVLGAIAEAERDGAAVLLVQIDSRGSLGADRARRIVDAIGATDVPVVAWIGPPGSVAENATAAIALAADVVAMAPGTALGPVTSASLTERIDPGPLGEDLPDRALSADAAERAGLVDLLALNVPELLDALEDLDVEGAEIRFRRLGVWGQALHATAQPSIAYLLLLVGLAGIMFEAFHPSTGPAGITAALGLALSGYGLWTLSASPLGVILLVAAVVFLSIDLRFAGLGLFSALGTVALVAGSLLLFRGPFLHVHPGALATGIVGMLTFNFGAMTRVLRDLRAIARGELEVTDAHPHPEEA